MKAHETWAFGFGRNAGYDRRISATTSSIIRAGDCGRLRTVAGMKCSIAAYRVGSSTDSMQKNAALETTLGKR